MKKSTIAILGISLLAIAGIAAIIVFVRKPTPKPGPPKPAPPV